MVCICYRNAFCKNPSKRSYLLPTITMLMTLGRPHSLKMNAAKVRFKVKVKHRKNFFLKHLHTQDKDVYLSTYM